MYAGSGTQVCRRCAEVTRDSVPLDEGEWRAIKDKEVNVIGSRVGTSKNYLVECFIRRKQELKESGQNGHIHVRKSENDPTMKKRKGGGVNTSIAAAAEDTESTVPVADVQALKFQMTRIRDICQKLVLKTKVSDHACQFFAHLRSMPLNEDIHGRSDIRRRPKLSDIIAASIYIACRFNKAPVTRREICALAKCTSNGSKHCVSLMSIFQRDTKLDFVRLTSVDYIPRITSHLDVSLAVASAAKTICVRAETARILNERLPAPATVAAVAVYLAACMEAEADSKSLKRKCIELLHLRKKTFGKIRDRILDKLDAILTTADFRELRRSDLCTSRLQGRV